MKPTLWAKLLERDEETLETSKNQDWELWQAELMLGPRDSLDLHVFSLS